MTLPYKDESYKIMGACFEVYKHKGAGLLESVYQECLAIEFLMQFTPFHPKVELQLEYKGRPLVSSFIPDFICYDQIIVEIKPASELCDAHRATVHNYLKATG